ncbi:MAG: hypothetical protein AAFX87_13780 [Bacteroidota bacterium]
MDMAEEINLNFSYKARYHKIGEISSKTKKVWFVLHGYGQLAKYFIKKFSILDNGENCIIAPEGLSRFYLQGFDGRIGATWMTREDRLNDIENYINYLTSVYNHELSNLGQTVEVCILGFSQGAATVSRWALSNEINFHSLVLWAGIFPEDMNFESGQSILKDKRVYNVYGTKDEFLTQERLDKQRVLCKKLGINPEEITFDGGHDINVEVLKSFL